MYEVDFAKQLETSPRPHHTLAAAFATTTGTGIDTRVVQQLMKTHTPETILDAITAMSGKQVDRPVAYLRGILKAKKRDSHIEQVKADKFQEIIDMAREANGELILRSPFGEPTPA